MSTHWPKNRKTDLKIRPFFSCLGVSCLSGHHPCKRCVGIAAGATAADGDQGGAAAGAMQLVGEKHFRYFLHFIFQLTFIEPLASRAVGR
jgi:hypothetical protein